MSLRIKLFLRIIIPCRKDPMFSLNEKVVYPGHGVAKISRVVEKKVGGRLTSFFELKFLDTEMTILVPVENLSSVGVRKVSTDEKIQELFKKLSEPVHSNGAQADCSTYCGSNWGKRLKRYQGKISTGDPLKICDIYRDLKLLATKKELSFGEKMLLQKIERLLAQEISIATRINEDQALAQLRARCNIVKRPLSIAGG
jgi:CarD family transcriptional regulator